MNSLNILPSELFTEIKKWLDIRSVFRLSITCKYILSSINFYSSSDEKLASYNFSVEQKETLENLKKYTHNKRLLLKAPPSMGKTVIALSFLLWEGGRNLIIVPPSLVYSWVSEIEKSFPALFSENPEESKTIVYHPSYRKHRLYVDKLNNLPDVPFVITSTTLRTSLKHHLYNRIVVDESHTIKISFSEWKMKGILLVSASERRNQACDGSVAISNKVVSNIVPSYRRFFIDAAISPLITVPKELLRYEKSVIFLSNMKEYFDLNIEGYKIFQHKQNNKIVEDFNLYNGKAILMSTYGKLSTGHNIEAQAAFFSHANKHNTTTLLQSESRLLRITNKEKEVSFHYLCEKDSQKLMEIRYTIILTEIERKNDIRLITSGYWRIKRGFMYRAFIKLNIRMEDLTDYEFLYYCNADVKGGQLRKFFEDKGLIDEEVKRRIIGYYPKI